MIHSESNFYLFTQVTKIIIFTIQAPSLCKIILHLIPCHCHTIRISFLLFDFMDLHRFRCYHAESVWPVLSMCNSWHLIFKSTGCILFVLVITHALPRRSQVLPCRYYHGGGQLYASRRSMDLLQKWNFRPIRAFMAHQVSAISYNN